MIPSEILSFIPQRPPFVMIDRLVSAEAASSETSFTVRQDHLFVEDGLFTQPGLVENMAQTAAAGTGYLAWQEGRKPSVGYIGALKGLQVNELPRIGDTITTIITFVHQVMNAHIVQGRINIGDREIATCELKIFLQSET